MSAATLDVSVILRLVDQIAGPAKKAAADIKNLTSNIKALTKAGADFSAVTRQVKAFHSSISPLVADLKVIGTELRRITGLSRTAIGSLNAAAGSNGAWAAQASHLKQIAALQQQLIRNQGRMGRAAGHGVPLIGALGLGFGAHRVGHAIASGFGKAGTLDSELAMLDLAGFSADQRQRMIAQAHSTANLVPQTTTAQNLHRLRELTYAFGDVEHALVSLTDTAKVMQVVTAAHGGERAGHFHDQVMEIVKGGELKNYINTPDEFRKWLDMTVRSSIATGGLVTPAATFQALKYARSAIHGYDDEFMSKYLPEIIQEMQTGRGGGARGGAGPSLAAFKRMFVDSTVAAKYIPALLKSGLIDAGHIDYDSHGKPKALLPGAFFGNEIAAKNPYEFMKQFLVPALQKAGVDLNDHSAIVRKISEWGGTDIAKQLNQLMVIQRDQMLKRTHLNQQAMGAESAFLRVMQTYTQTLEALKATTTDLVANVLEKFEWALVPAMQSLQHMLGAIRNVFAGGFGSWLAGGGALVGGGLLLGMLPRLLGGGLLGRLLIGAAGAALLGPGGALLGLATGVGGLVGPATAAAAALGTVAIVLGSVAAAVGVLAVGYGAFMETKRRVEEFNALSKSQQLDPRKVWTDPMSGLPIVGQDVANTGAGALADAGKGAASEGSSAGSSWGAAFMSAMKSALSAVTNLVPTGNLTAQGASAGRAWAQAFIGAAQGAMAGAVISGPKVTPGAPASSGGGAAAAAGKQARVHGHRNVSVAAMHIHVHGADHPHKVADAVHRTFARSVDRALSDGAYA
jgi:hypothetical protein